MNNIREIVMKLCDACADMDQNCPPSCSDEDLMQLETAVWEKYHIRVPCEYLGVLRVANGISYDGSNFFGAKPHFLNEGQEWPDIDGVLEFNAGELARKSLPPDTLAFGENGHETFCISKNANEVIVYDIYGKETRHFDSFEKAFRQLFRIPL